MARMLLDPPNFLVLDEPTNHLDLETKEMLVEALKEFEGTMLFVSHDRTFLKGLGTRVLELEYGDGRRAAAAHLPRQLPRVRAEDGPRGAGGARLVASAVGRSNRRDHLTWTKRALDDPEGVSIRTM